MQQQQQQQDVQGMESSGGSHKMSIALVIGATIGAIGVVLVLTGLFGHSDYSRSNGVNINLWWGLLMVVFGLLMSGINYLMSYRRQAP